MMGRSILKTGFMACLVFGVVDFSVSVDARGLAPLPQQKVFVDRRCGVDGYGVHRPEQKQPLIGGHQNMMAWQRDMDSMRAERDDDRELMLEHDKDSRVKRSSFRGTSRRSNQGIISVETAPEAEPGLSSRVGDEDNVAKTGEQVVLPQLNTKEAEKNLNVKTDDDEVRKASSTSSSSTWENVNFMAKQVILYILLLCFVGIYVFLIVRGIMSIGG